MFPHQAFVGGDVQKVKGNGKGRYAKIIEVNFLTGLMLIEFNDNKLREWANPYEYVSLPNDSSYKKSSA